MNTIVTGIMGENMPLFQRVLNISKQCTDDIYDPSREGCSSLLSENKINCTPEKMPKESDIENHIAKFNFEEEKRKKGRQKER